MRIIAGSKRGLRLAQVGKGDPAAQLRPTSDRVREALFNTLQGGRFGDPITDAIVLDLFAGTGALAFEALSRGAGSATLVEKAGKARALISQNLWLTGFQGDVVLLPLDALRLKPNSGDAATLVFLDPPYSKSLGARALDTALAQGWIAPNAMIVWEEAAPQPAPNGFVLLEHRRYGDTHVTFLKASSE